MRRDLLERSVLPEQHVFADLPEVGVWIEVGGIDVILNTVRSQVFNPDIFTNFGIDLLSKSLLVVKSTNHFHDAFSRISKDILYASVDGPYPNDPATNDYRNLTRDIWPRVENPHGTVIE